MRPVQWTSQVEALYAAGTRVFVEFGPRGVLTGLVRRILGDRPHVAVALDAGPGRCSERQLREGVVQLRVLGLQLGELDRYRRPPEAPPAPTTLGQSLDDPAERRKLREREDPRGVRRRPCARPRQIRRQGAPREHRPEHFRTTAAGRRTRGPGRRGARASASAPAAPATARDRPVGVVALAPRAGDEAAQEGGPCRGARGDAAAAGGDAAAARAVRCRSDSLRRDPARDDSSTSGRVADAPADARTRPASRGDGARGASARPRVGGGPPEPSRPADRPSPSIAVRSSPRPPRPRSQSRETCSRSSRRRCSRS